MTSIEPSDREITEIIGPYGFDVSPALCDQIRAYIALLLRWNQKISLTTVTKPHEILRFHFGESFVASSFIPNIHSRLADVGSGAGFPGLALRLYFSQIEVVLIESNIKKAAFLSEVTRELGLNGVEVFRGRMEDFDPGAEGVNFVTARALGQHEELLKWSHSALNEDGKLIMWLGGEDASAISKRPSWNWQKPAKIQPSLRRFLLVGSPVKLPKRIVPRGTICAK